MWQPADLLLRGEAAMYCSKCGATVAENQSFCSGCGQATPRASLELTEQQKLQRTVRRLSRYWFLFAGLSVVLGALGLIGIQTGMTSHGGPWEPWPHPYIWNWTLAGSIAWTLLSLRLAAAVAAGWGLARRTDWSRWMTLVAAGAAFTEFPIGFVLALYTFSALLGKHHAALYANLVTPATTVGVR